MKTQISDTEGILNDFSLLRTQMLNTTKLRVPGVKKSYLLVHPCENSERKQPPPQQTIHKLAVNTTGARLVTLSLEHANMQDPNTFLACQGKNNNTGTVQYDSTSEMWVGTLIKLSPTCLHSAVNQHTFKLISRTVLHNRTYHATIET
eukprot:8031996-Pyramimonas_sp.AAC.1